jgi:hypothetical protein
MVYQNRVCKFDLILLTLVLPRDHFFQILTKKRVRFSTMSIIETTCQNIEIVKHTASKYAFSMLFLTHTDLLPFVTIFVCNKITFNLTAFNYLDINLSKRKYLPFKCTLYISK